MPTGLPATSPRLAGLTVESLPLRDPQARARFIGMMANVYEADPGFAMPLWRDQRWWLDPTRCPIHQELDAHALIARWRGRDVGRLLVHIHRGYDRAHGPGTGWFGFFECIDDTRVAGALFEAGLAWLVERRVKRVQGPVNYSTWGAAGLLVESLRGRPGVGSAYNLGYYPRLLADLGMRPHRESTSWAWDLITAASCPAVGRASAEAERTREVGQVRVRPIDTRRLEQELDPWHGIMNAIAREGAIEPPMGRAEFDAMAFDIARIAVEGLVLAAESNGRPVGVLAAVPDVTPLLPRNGRLLPFAWYRLLRGRARVSHARVHRPWVLPGFQGRGIESLLLVAQYDPANPGFQFLLVELASRARAKGFRQAEIAGIWEEEHSTLAAIRTVGGRLVRRHQLFQVRLD